MNTKKLRWITAAFLSLIMCISFIPTMVFADSGYYDIWVQGVRVTDSNLDDVLSDGGSVSYDPQTSKLILNNASIIGQYAQIQDNENVGIESRYPIEIVLIGNNTIQGQTGSVNSMGIHIYSDLTISGSGSLNVTAGTGERKQSYAVCSDGTLTINGGQITAAGAYGRNWSTGLYAVNSIYINGGSIIASGNKDYQSVGLNAHGPVYITGGEVEARGDTRASRDVFDFSGYEGTVTVTVSEEKNPEVPEEWNGEDPLGGDDSPFRYVKITGSPFTYSVTIDSAIENGSVSADPASEIFKGETVTLTVTPEEGFELETLTVTDEYGYAVPMESETTFLMPLSDVNVTAVFKEIVYDVTIDSGIEGGSVSADPASEISKGKTVTLTVTPEEGFELETLTVTDEDGNAVAMETETTFLMPASDVTVSAVFSKIPVYTVTFETNGGSSVDPQSIVRGSKAAEPEDPSRSGFTFDGWYADTDLTASFDFSTEITADTVVYAKWTEVVPDPVTYQVVSGGNGTWKKGSGTDHELTVERSADDDTCFDHFVSVQIDGTTLTSGTDYTAKAGSTVITLKASALQKLSVGSHTVTVNFDDGKADTSLTVKAADKTPDTSDGSHTGLWTALMFLSLMIAGGAAAFGRKYRGAR